MKSESIKKFSLFVILLFFVGFVYVVYEGFGYVSKRQISTSDGVYTNKVTTSKEIQQQADILTKGCKSKLCEVQQLLDYVTHIPYQINHWQAKSPQQTIQNNFGDCDDKSNLLISLLHAQNIEAYFVLVPEHIFIVVSLEDTRLKKTKGLYIDGKKHYILESTAKGSQVGYLLQYTLQEIEAIVEPFSNTKLKVEKLSFGY